MQISMPSLIGNLLRKGSSLWLTATVFDRERSEEWHDVWSDGVDPCYGMHVMPFSP